MDSLCHLWFTTTSLSYRFPIFETSATALCGTTGNLIDNVCTVFSNISQRFFWHYATTVPLVVLAVVLVKIELLLSSFFDSGTEVGAVAFPFSRSEETPTGGFWVYQVYWVYPWAAHEETTDRWTWGLVVDILQFGHWPVFACLCPKGRHNQMHIQLNMPNLITRIRD